MGVSTTIIGNKSVIIVDFIGIDISNFEDIKAILKEGSALVATKPEKSVYIITNVANLKFNADVAAGFKEYATVNSKYIKESVLVGLNGMQTLVFQTIKTMTKRDYHLSSTMNDARTYLASLK